MSIGSLTRVRNRRLARLDELLKERILILDSAFGTIESDRALPFPKDLRDEVR
jgi:hypothetical protein